MEDLVKSPAWHERRRSGIGGSDANILMNGSPADILKLWELKVGKAEPEDLSHVLPVQIGVVTESLNRHWYEMATGEPVLDDGKFKRCAAYDFMTCTLDGMTQNSTGDLCVFEAKHVNQFANIAEVAQKYMPQLHHNMFVCGVGHAVLSVFIGTFTHEIVEVECASAYLSQLIEREKAFWKCVEDNTPPADMEPLVAPVPFDQLKTVDMTGNNEWASLATDWVENKEASQTFTKAAKAIKELVEHDVGLAEGHGIQAKRSKNNAIRITEQRKK